MGRGVRVFHAPGQSPYSVLVEQRGVDQLLLLESQVSFEEKNRGVYTPHIYKKQSIK